MTMKFKITFHRNPSERTRLEKIARRFILPPHPPRAMALGSWGDRDEKLKKHFPIRFFMWETFPELFEQYINRPYRDCKRWVRFRTWDKYHILKLDVSKSYHDPDYIMLHSNFQILRNYVEIELAAWSEVNNDGISDEQTSSFTRFRKVLHGMKFKKQRNPAAGLRHLDWEIRDTSGYQQSSAKEQKALYLWWTIDRPLREEPYDSRLFDDHKDDDTSFKAIMTRPYDKELVEARHDMEKYYDAEDEEMLIRLMKIRKSLWS